MITKVNTLIPKEQEPVDNTPDQGILGWILIILSGIASIFLFPFYIRVVSEYQRAVIFRLGRLLGMKSKSVAEWDIRM